MGEQSSTSKQEIVLADHIKLDRKLISEFLNEILEVNDDESLHLITSKGAKFVEPETLGQDISKVVKTGSHLKKIFKDSTGISHKIFNSIVGAIFMRFGDSYVIVKEKLTELFDGINIVEGRENISTVNSILSDLLKRKIEADIKIEEHHKNVSKKYDRLFPDNVSIALNNDWKIIDEKLNESKDNPQSEDITKEKVETLQVDSETVIITSKKTLLDSEKTDKSTKTSKSLNEDSTDKKGTTIENTSPRFYFLKLKNKKNITLLSLLLFFVILFILLKVFLPHTTSSTIENTNNDSLGVDIKKDQIPPPIVVVNSYRDSLYILVSRFKNQINDSISNNPTTYRQEKLVGLSVYRLIDDLKEKYSLPINIKYREDIAPIDKFSAERIRKFHNADVLLWGYGYFGDNNKGDIRFRFTPSEKMIENTDNQILKEGYSYNKNISLIDIEEGNLLINGIDFENWLRSMLKIKVSKFNPQYYTISDTLSKNDKALEFYNLSKIYWNLSNNEDALKWITKAINLDPKNPKFWVAKADYYHFTNNEKAIINIQKAIELNPLNFDFKIKKASIYETNHNYKKTEEIYNNLIKTNSFESKYWEERASFYSRIYNYKKAELDYTEAIRLEPSNLRLRKEIISFYSKFKDYKKAHKELDRLIKIDPSDISLLYEKIILYEKVKDIKKIEEVYNNIITLAPLASNCWIDRASFYESIHKYEETESDYTEAIQLNSSIHSFINSYTTELRAEFYVKINEKEKAESDYTKIIQLDSSNGYSWILRADFFKNINEKEKAESDYSTAIQLDSLNRYFRSKKASLYAKNNSDKILTDYIEAISSAPSDNMKAEMAKRINNYEYGQEQYNKLVKSNQKYKKERADFYLRQTEKNKLCCGHYDSIKIYWAKNGKKFKQESTQKVFDLYKKAEKDYTDLINLTPNDQQLLLARAKFYTKTKIFQKAEEDYNKVLKIVPYFPRYWIERASLYKKQKKYFKALNDYTRAIQLDSLNPDHYENRGEAYQLQNNIADAEKDFNRAIDLDSLNPERWIKRGEFYKSVSLYEKAEEAYTKAIKLDSFDYNNWQERIRFYRKTNQQNKAIVDYEKITEIWNKDLSKLKEIARVFKDYNRLPTKEAQVYTKIILLDSLNRAHWKARAEAYDRAKMYDKAVEDYDYLIQLDSTNIGNWRLKINFLKRIKKYEDVTKSYKELISLDSLNSSRWLFPLANYHASIKNFKEAEKYYTKIISMDSSRIFSWKSRADFYRTVLYSFDKAEKDYTKIINLDSSDFKSWTSRGGLYKDLGLCNKADSDYSQLLQLKDTTRIKDLIDIASFYSSIKEYDKAEKYYRKAALHELSDWGTFWKIRAFYLHSNQYDKARKAHFNLIRLDSISKVNERLNPTDPLKNYEDMSDEEWDFFIKSDMLMQSFIFFGITGNDSEKIKYLSQLIDMNYNYLIYKNLRTKLYVKSKNYNKAIEEYSSILTESENKSLNKKVLLQRAKVYSLSGNNDLAELDFNKAIELDSLIFDSWYERAEFYEKNGLFEKAIGDYENAFILKPRLSKQEKNNILFSLAHLYNRALKNIDKAEDYYTKIIQLDSLNPYYWKCRADFYLSVKKPKKAKIDIEQALSLDTEHLSKIKKILDSLYIEPQIRRKKGQISYYLNSEEDSIFSKAQYENIDLYIKSIKSDSSLFTLIMSKKSDPRFNTIKNQIGNRFYTADDYTKIIKLDSTYPINWVLRGDYFAKIGNVKQANLDYTKAIFLDSSNTMRWKSKALFHFQQQEYEIAINHFNKAISLFNLSDRELLHDLWFDKARAYFKLSEYKQASQDFYKSFKIQPNSRTFFHLLYTYLISYWYIFILVLSIIFIVSIKKFRLVIIKSI